MVVQHILTVRRGRREVKVPIESPAVKTEGVAEDSTIEVKTEKTEEETAAATEATEATEAEKSEPLAPEMPPEEEAPKEEKSEEPIEDVKVDSTSEKPLDETKPEAFKTEMIDVDEFFVKYRNFSYLHCEWKTEDELRRGDRRIFSKIKRFQQKMANNVNIFELVSDDF